MPDASTERRAAPRYPLILIAEVTEVESGARLSARTSDVSRTGCYIDTLNPTPVGTAIYLRLSQSGEAFETRARIVYISPGLGMGVAFVDVPPAQQALLDKWLAAAVSG